MAETKAACNGPVSPDHSERWSARMAKKTHITHERLREVLDYNPKTGIFTWKIALSPRANVGGAAGRTDRRGYIRIGIDGKYYQAHRLAWFYINGVWPKNQIDHRNLNPSDNREDNLRDATPSQNGFNRKPHSNNKSGHKGIYWDKREGRWRAEIRIKRKYAFVKYFDDLQDAIIAHSEAAKLHCGEFAYTQNALPSPKLT
jgi:hypothetical protein